jgi:hypothetical protein
MVLGAASLAVAEPKGNWQRAPQSPEEHAKRAAERVANEAVDAVVDELAGPQSSAGVPGSMPPGLAKKGKMPPGLAKQGKVPPGWEKGKKTGWGGEPKQESFIRRMIKGIFRRGEPAAPAAQ